MSDPHLKKASPAAGPALAEIRSTAALLRPMIVHTPLWQWPSERIAAALGSDTKVHLKLELFQRAGSFKSRAALATISGLTAEQKRAGVTAVSAGNHAIAVSYAAKLLGVSAKVVMPQSASPVRIEQCRHYGAELVLTSDFASAFTTVEEIARNEGRWLVHPFEGEPVALGTATLGLELAEDLPSMEALVVPVGGGGLAAGVAAAIKQVLPHCKVLGVEPAGAATLSNSLKLGRAARLPQVASIADSLSPPHSEPYSFSLCKAFLDKAVTVTDDELCAALAILFSEMKLAVEPAAAAGVAAILGPLAAEVRGKVVCVLISGTNIDAERYIEYLRRGQTIIAAGT